MDAFGFYPNAKETADKLADKGFIVVMPDIVHDDPLVNMNNVPEWLALHGPETVEPAINVGLAYLQGVENIENIGAVGYCFGGKYVVRSLGEQSTNIRAGFIAHPSFVSHSEFEAIKKPLAIAAARKTVIPLRPDVFDLYCAYIVLKKPTRFSISRDAIRPRNTSRPQVSLIRSRSIRAPPMDSPFK